LEEKKKRSQLKFARMREGLGRVNVSKTMEPELFHQLSMEETREEGSSLCFVVLHAQNQKKQENAPIWLVVA
jgi:hypothetical protein